MELVDPEKFAYAVVSGNPCEGNTPEEISENAFELYNAAILIAEKKLAEKKAEDKKPWLV